MLYSYIPSVNNLKRMEKNYIYRSIKKNKILRNKFYKASIRLIKLKPKNIVERN